jgi:hypothetical protein
MRGRTRSRSTCCADVEAEPGGGALGGDDLASAVPPGPHRAAAPTSDRRTRGGASRPIYPTSAGRPTQPQPQLADGHRG